MNLLRFCVLFACSLSVAGFASAQNAPSSVHDFTLKDIKGNDVALSSYKGKTVMLVNVASKCGHTPQYEALEKIYRQYSPHGFVVLGFPANDFGNQEPGTEEQIEQFCKTTYGVSFPLFSKISVKGDQKHPLYQFLTSAETNPKFAGEIGWNFTKFLVSADGRVVARFDSGTKPDSPQVIQAIEAELKQTGQEIR